jgi:hypothetical protein
MRAWQGMRVRRASTVSPQAGLIARLRPPSRRSPSAVASPWTRLGLRLDPAGCGGLERLSAVAQAAEGAGFDCLWLACGRLDPFVTAAALAPLTSTVRLGCLDYPLGGRPPSLLAKAVASLDVISAGRAAVGVEVGTGLLGRSREALEVLRLMLVEEAPTFEGEHFTIRGAYNEPRRRRPGGPPPLVAHISGPPEKALVGATVPLVDGLAVSSADGRLGEMVAGAPPAAVRFALIGVVAAMPTLEKQVEIAGQRLKAGCTCVVLDAGDSPLPAAVAALGEAAGALLPAGRQGGSGGD